MFTVTFIINRSITLFKNILKTDSATIETTSRSTDQNDPLVAIPQPTDPSVVIALSQKVKCLIEQCLKFAKHPELALKVQHFKVTNANLVKISAKIPQISRHWKCALKKTCLYGEYSKNPPLIMKLQAAKGYRQCLL